MLLQLILHPKIVLFHQFFFLILANCIGSVKALHNDTQLVDFIQQKTQSQVGGFFFTHCLFLDHIRSLSKPYFLLYPTWSVPLKPAAKFHPFQEQWEALSSQERSKRCLSDKEVCRSGGGGGALTDSGSIYRHALFLPVLCLSGGQRHANHFPSRDLCLAHKCCITTKHGCFELMNILAKLVAGLKVLKNMVYLWLIALSYYIKHADDEPMFGRR